jgi:FtsH-binding integral membrane protein
MGIGFLLSIRWLMGMALFVVALMSIFAQTSAAEGGDPQPPESRRARVGWGVVLVIVGVAVGVFFSAAA